MNPMQSPNTGVGRKLCQERAGANKPKTDRFVVLARFPSNALDIPVVDAPDGLTRSEAEQVLGTAKAMPGYKGARLWIKPFKP